MLLPIPFCERIDAAFRQFVQLPVSVLLFLEGPLEELERLGMAHHPRVLADGAVRGDLVVLHLLRGDDDARIQDVGIRVFLQQALSLLDEALHALALHAARRLTQRFQDRFQPRDVLLGFGEVIVERRAEFVGARVLRHPRKSLHQLPFGAVQVLQLMDHEVVQGS